LKIDKITRTFSKQDSEQRQTWQYLWNSIYNSLTIDKSSHLSKQQQQQHHSTTAQSVTVFQCRSSKITTPTRLAKSSQSVLGSVIPYCNDTEDYTSTASLHGKGTTTRHPTICSPQNWNKSLGHL